MSRPKHGNDVKWISKTFTKAEVLDKAKKSTKEMIFDFVISTIIGVGSLGTGVIASFVGVYSGIQKQNLVNDMLEAIKYSDSVTVSLKYIAYRKGNSGLFWLPTDEYEIN